MPLLKNLPGRCQRAGYLFGLAGALSACGGSTVSSGGSSTGGAAAGGSTPVTCDVVGATVAHLNGDPNVVACVKANCSANLPPCLGTDFALGNFGSSPCASYASCVNSCTCASPCTNNCTIPTECVSCLTNNVAACGWTHCM